MTELVSRPLAAPTHTPWVFRFRVVLFVALYLVGFNVPWSKLYQPGTHSSTWIVLSSLLARTGFLNLSLATITVTIFAIAASLAGAALRLWATAYLGAGVMSDKSLRAERVMASGPYRYVRNPLYLGLLLTNAAVAILMPPAGAIFFMAGCLVLTAALVILEKPHLEQQLGEPYTAYRRQVPAFIPAIRTHVPGTGARPQWLPALAAESFEVGFALCMLFLAWQYNAYLLIRCLVICAGSSMVANGVFSSRSVRAVAPPLDSTPRQL